MAQVLDIGLVVEPADHGEPLRGAPVAGGFDLDALPGLQPGRQPGPLARLDSREGGRAWQTIPS